MQRLSSDQAAQCWLLNPFCDCTRHLLLRYTSGHAIGLCPRSDVTDCCQPQRSPDRQLIVYNPVASELGIDDHGLQSCQANHPRPCFRFDQSHQIPGQVDITINIFMALCFGSVTLGNHRPCSWNLAVSGGTSQIVRANASECGG